MPDTRIPIPDEVVEAFLNEWLGYLDSTMKARMSEEARAAIAAMLAAWPGAWEWPDTAEGRALVLPLQEARDD